MTRTFRNTPDEMVDEIAGHITAFADTIEYAQGADMSPIVGAARQVLAKVAAITEPELLSGLLNATDLDKMTFPDLNEHVPGLIVEGMTLLVGPPKVGKSWLGGDFACGCASGGMVLSAIPVVARPVLLVSLEDSKRRLQSRLKKIMRGQPLPRNLDVLTEVHPKLVLATIAEWLQQHRDSAPMVILDTLGKARQSAPSNNNQYQEDYGFAGSIKAVIDDVPGAALVAVHHTRKQGADDFLDTVSGTQGIAGAADSVIVLARKRKSDEGVLSVTGRDIEENEYAVRTEGGLWSLDGQDITDAAATVDTRRERSAENRLGDRKLDTIKFVNSRETTTPSDLAAHLGISDQIAGTRLAELYNADIIAKPKRGVYAPRESRESRESPGEGNNHPPANSRDSRDSRATVTPLFTNTQPEGTA
ncbi:AAA family ATPase [Mycolicibacterium austroafricanum]|uniref:AAA family ATPase n=1 Tax=Mycolicibacterium austroafricanum TaxID=39687 RepID=UPI001CA3733D|nr:AAA family ATPase [Mycolicibacterium austroafricanum]QZT54612.1 helicase RepA family protein [Mycolicibacterium austroafricanum]